MTFKYRVGQRVTVVDGDGDWQSAARKYLSIVATIISTGILKEWSVHENHNYYRLDCTDEYWFSETVLKPLNDGDNPSTWNECAWRPNLEHTVLPSPTPVTEKETA